MRVVMRYASGEREPSDGRERRGIKNSFKISWMV